MIPKQSKPQVDRHAEPCTADCPAMPVGLRSSGRIPNRASGRRMNRFLLPFLVLCATAVLFVGWDVLVHRLFPTMPTGLRHLLLTTWAALITILTSLAVYLTMRAHQRRLTETAEHLSQLLESYDAGTTYSRRFENPHLVHCREVLSCQRTDCPMYDAPGERCWQYLALNGSDRDPSHPQVDLQRCHECEVYRLSCPDKLTELGESFNNLMFLLHEESKKTRRMRAQMVERQKMFAVGQLASGIAHEIGNPLSSISSIVQLLKRSGREGPQVDELNLIETHIQRISTIVRQLNTLSRPEAEQWGWFDIAATLDEAVRLVSFDRRARDIDIDLQIQNELPHTYALRGQLQQVFINVLLNAMDAMPNGGKLLVRGQTQGQDILVKIRDTGDGMPDAAGRRVFEPFFTTKEPGAGTGLGLAVSYNIVQKHGGTIDFSSTVGEGTEFTILIPHLSRPPERDHGAPHEVPESV